MVTQASPQMRQSEEGGLRPRGAPTRFHRASRWQSGFVFIATAGTLLAYALPGGTYDIVVRQEYGIVVWWVLAIGYALGLFPRAHPSRPALVLIAALAAYTAWTAASLAWSDSGERTTAEIMRVIDYLGIVLLVVSVLDRATWRAATMGLGFGALVVCGLAVASRLAPGAFPAR